MQIRVQGFLTMRKYTSHLPHNGELEVAEGSTVGSLLKHLEVPSDQQKTLLFFVNGRHRPADHVLQPNDLFVFFPPLEGG